MGKVETTVFLSLVLDLFAFTIPLPLFPRLIEWYTVRESADPSGFLSQTLHFVSNVRGLLYKADQHSKKWDVVLLGGLMGSVFSTLQFIVSPQIGALSDRYGRKRILLITMIGNIASAVVWIQSTSFASYMLSRVIGGLSEGNVQLAIAILSDVTTPENRAKALAHVGIAFAICFCIGPPIGAYFASRPLPPAFNTWGAELNVYAMPAILTLILLVLETFFLAVALPETRGTRMHVVAKDKIAATVNETSSDSAKGFSNATSSDDSSSVTASVKRPISTAKERLDRLKTLRILHFLFLGIFSGIEFTLTFLTFDLFDWNNRQNGTLIGSIGVISAFIQGGYVRRAKGNIVGGLPVMAMRGVSSCAVGLVLLAILPQLVANNMTAALRLLQGAAVCLAFTSATVVNALTSYASLQCDEGVDQDTGRATAEHPQLAKGKALGQFRSSGQLGRAIGPLIACASYWSFGPSITYAISAAAMLSLSFSMKTLVSPKVSS